MNTDEVDKDNIAEHEEWIDAIDREGVSPELLTVHFNTLCYRNMCKETFHHYCNAINMDQLNILFYWCMAGLDESDEDNLKCLEMKMKNLISI